QQALPLLVHNKGTWTTQEKISTSHQRGLHSRPHSRSRPVPAPGRQITSSNRGGIFFSSRLLQARNRRVHHVMPVFIPAENV
ncbi:unnamed protein product, partial [Ascophyllum nodosum]